MRKIVLTGLLVMLAALAIVVHTLLPRYVERSLNGMVEHPPYVIDAETEALHRSLFVADLHNDSLLWKRDLATRSDYGHVDLPRLSAGNVALQVFSATTKSPSGQNYASNSGDSDNITALAVLQLWPPRTWRSLYERAAYQLERLRDLARRSGGRLVLIQSREDIAELARRRAAGEPVTGAVYLIEGAHALDGELANLDRLHARGLSIVGLTHFFDNRLGGSLHGRSGAGLSAFGRDVVRRAGELGMIVDVAHASPAMVRDVLAISERPVLLSHGGFDGVCPGPRNLDDALMRDIAAAGGLIGVGFWHAAVCDITPAGIVRSISYGIDLLGIDHVALGSDFDGATTVALDASELAVLTQEMRAAGFSREEIRKVMGDNVRRFLAENLPGRAEGSDVEGSAELPF